MSTLRAATIADLAGTGPATLTGQTAAKAWFNLNGTGTIAGRASQNISSYTDNGTGDYTGNITSALVDANYAVVFGQLAGTPSNVTAVLVVGGTLSSGATLKTTTAVRILSGSSASGSLADSHDVSTVLVR
jgi:hypothetical protein